MSGVGIQEATVEQTREIIDRLVAFNQRRAGQENVSPINLSLVHVDRCLCGGIKAASSWDTLVVDVLWIDETARGLGYGSLLAEAERRARQLGCKRAVLETFSFQAEGFYRHHGYRAVGTISELPPAGHLSRMMKVLST